MDHGGWHRMSPETQSRLDEGRLAMAKTALKLSADQEKLWSAVETEVRAAFKMRSEKMAERAKMREERQKAGEKSGEQSMKKPDVSERFEKMAQNMGDRAERMKAFASAFKPFYASLSDEQKDVLRPLMRDLMPGDGRGGHGHGGKRWADGGGEGRGWGHHGGWGGHHGKRHEGRGGPMMDERGGGGGGSDGSDRAPPAPQFAPEQDGGDESPVPADKL
jgi:hypothetical protein